MLYKNFSFNKWNLKSTISKKKSKKKYRNILICLNICEIFLRSLGYLAL